MKRRLNNPGTISRVGSIEISKRTGCKDAWNVFTDSDNGDVYILSKVSDKRWFVDSVGCRLVPFPGPISAIRAIVGREL